MNYLFFICIFNCEFGPLPKDSEPNPTSFQFLPGGRLTQILYLPPNPKTLATRMMASRQVAVKHGFVSKIAGGCSSYDVIAP